MCLSALKGVIDQPTDKEQVAWKVLRKRHVWTREDKKEIKYVSPVFPSMMSAYPNGTWMQANTDAGDIEGGEGRFYYTPGFHVFQTREAARAYKRQEWSYGDARLRIVKVKVRKVRTIGYQHGLPPKGAPSKEYECWVADEMFIPVQEEKK